VRRSRFPQDELWEVTTRGGGKDFTGAVTTRGDGPRDLTGAVRGQNNFESSIHDFSVLFSF